MVSMGDGQKVNKSGLPVLVCQEQDFNLDGFQASRPIARPSLRDVTGAQMKAMIMVDCTNLKTSHDHSVMANCLKNVS